MGCGRRRAVTGDAVAGTAASSPTACVRGELVRLIHGCRPARFQGRLFSSGLPNPCLWSCDWFNTRAVVPEAIDKVQNPLDIYLDLLLLILLWIAGLKFVDGNKGSGKLRICTKRLSICSSVSASFRYATHM
jgi:hypothetical protein